MDMKKNETVTSALENRISSQKNQTIDLNEWIFGNLKVDPGCNALELCCGVGAQTKYFTQKIKQGNLDCIDINPESIEKAKASIDNEKVNFIVSEIDDAEQHIDKKYDIIFCAYGFYYSK